MHSTWPRDFTQGNMTAATHQDVKSHVPVYLFAAGTRLDIGADVHMMMTAHSRKEDAVYLVNFVSVDGE